MGMLPETNGSLKWRLSEVRKIYDGLRRRSARGLPLTACRRKLSSTPDKRSG
jgi:hypothetical protein